MHLSDRTTARIVGWLFIATFAFSIPGLLLYGPMLNDPRFVLGTADGTQITVGALLEILLVIANIGTAVALYPVAKRYSHRVGLGYVATRIMESAIIVAGIASVLSVLALRDQFAGADPDTLVATAGVMVGFHDATFLLGPGFCAGIGNGMLLGYLMFKSGLMPRRIAILGPIAGGFCFVAATGALLGVYEQGSAPQFLLTVPEMIWELTFGIYLIAKGFAAPTTLRAPSSERAAVAAVAAR